MQLEDHGVICDTTKRSEAERIAFFNGLFIATSSSIFCSCQIGPAKNSSTSTLKLFRSRDGGISWIELGTRFETKFGGVPGSFSSCQIVEVEKGRLLLISTWYDRSDPSRELFDPVTEGLLFSKQLKSFSTDDGNTWTAWEQIGVGDLTGCSSTGPILRWSNGVIAFPFESLKSYNDRKPAVPGAWCVLSYDNGKTFGEPRLIARHPENKVFYWDQRLCTGKASGDFLALFWTHDIEQKRDLTVHFCKGSLTDPAAPSPVIRETGIPGQISAPLLLEDGRLLAFVVDREMPGTITLWLSHDGGKTWPERLVVYTTTVRGQPVKGVENVDYVEYWADMVKWTYGHPAIRSLGEGKVMLSYYAGVPDRLSLFWATVKVGSNATSADVRNHSFESEHLEKYEPATR